jgi:hypothetical protein
MTCEHRGNEIRVRRNNYIVLLLTFWNKNKIMNRNRMKRGLGENYRGGTGAVTVTTQFCRQIHNLFNPLKTDRDLRNSERPGEREVHGMCDRQFMHNNFH